MPIDTKRWKRNTILIFGVFCLIIFVIIGILIVLAVIYSLMGW